MYSDTPKNFPNSYCGSEYLFSLLYTLNVHKIYI